MPRFVALLVIAVVCFGSACSSNCICPGCPIALRLDIMHLSGVTPTVNGSPELTCTSLGSSTRCVRPDAEPGSYPYEITIPGFTPVSVALEAARSGAADGCCACRYLDRSETVFIGVGPLDGGPFDAGSDAGTTDAGTIDAGTTDASDASSGDAGAACDPERVEFQPPGELRVGQLCDDVYACVADATAAAALHAAASGFDCTSEPSGEPCAAGSVRCVLRPSVIDEAELAQICAVTALEPVPEPILCRVYL